MIAPVLISVVVPCYNQARFLRRCVKSVLDAYLQNIEILIVDDGSTDDTLSVARTIDGPVTIIRQSNAGLSAARNIGLRHATGQFVYLLDADDYVLSDAFGEVCRNQLTSTEADVLFGNWQVVSADEKFQRIDEPRLIEGPDTVHQLLAGNAFPVHAAITRRVKFVEAGDFDTILRGFEDWDMWIRIAKAGGMFQRIEPTICAYRQSAGSMSRSHTRMLESGLTVIRKHRFAHGKSCRKCKSLQAEAAHQLRYHLYMNCLRDEIQAARKAQGLLSALRLLGRSVWSDPGLAMTLIRIRWEMLRRTTFGSSGKTV